MHSNIKAVANQSRVSGFVCCQGTQTHLAYLAWPRQLNHHAKSMECYPNTPKLWLQYGKRCIFGWMQRAACLSHAKLAMLQPPRLYLRSGPGKWGSDWFLEVGEYGQREKWCPNGLQALFYNFCMPVRPRFLNQQDLSIDHITVSETLKARLPQASSHLAGSSASCTRKQSIKLPKLRNLDESLCKPPKCHSIHSKKERFSRSSVGVNTTKHPLNRPNDFVILCSFHLS